MGAPNFFAGSRRDSLGKQPINARWTYLDPRSRLAVRHSGSLTSGESARGITIRHRCFWRKTPCQHFARVALAIFQLEDCRRGCGPFVGANLRLTWFRGNLAEPDRATASLWCELTGLTWRDRTAEAIMLGAALYNRKIELQQLYIRQKSNQFTLSGEAALPGSSSEWLRPDFRGSISASINQLGEFLGLFGANPADFDGKINIQGSMDTNGRNFGGHLTLVGASLTLFGHEIASLN